MSRWKLRKLRETQGRETQGQTQGRNSGNSATETQGQTERFLIFFEETRFETQGQTERFLIFFEKTRFGHNDWKLRDRRNVFSYFLKRLVLVIMIGDFQNRETSRLSRLSRLSKRAGGQAFRGASPVRRGRNGGCPHEHVVLASDHAAYRL